MLHPQDILGGVPTVQLCPVATASAWIPGLGYVRQPSPRSLVMSKVFWERYFEPWKYFLPPR